MLGCVLSVCLAFSKPTKLISKVVALLSLPMKVWEVPELLLKLMVSYPERFAFLERNLRISLPPVLSQFCAPVSSTWTFKLLLFRSLSALPHCLSFFFFFFLLCSSAVACTQQVLSTHPFDLVVVN